MLALLSPSSQPQLLTVGTDRSNKILVVNLRTICERGGGMWHAWAGREMCARFLWEKPDGKRPFARIRRRWVYSIETGLKYISWYGVDWIHLVHLANIWMWSTPLVIIWIQCAKRNLWICFCSEHVYFGIGFPYWPIRATGYLHLVSLQRDTGVRILWSVEEIYPAKGASS